MYLRTLGPALCETAICLRPPRCVSTGPVVVRLAGMANERERERERETAVHREDFSQIVSG